VGHSGWQKRWRMRQRLGGGGAVHAAGGFRVGGWLGSRRLARRPQRRSSSGGGRGGSELLRRFHSGSQKSVGSTLRSASGCNLRGGAWPFPRTLRRRWSSGGGWWSERHRCSTSARRRGRRVSAEPAEPMRGGNVSGPRPLYRRCSGGSAGRGRAGRVRSFSGGALWLAGEVAYASATRWGRCRPRGRWTSSGWMVG